MNERLQIICGDALTELRKLPSESVHCCVTSPPFWGLRDYQAIGQYGLEKSPEEYVAKMVEVFREVRRVLRKDGTLWLNLGDSYVSTARTENGGPVNRGNNIPRALNIRDHAFISCGGGLNPKDLCGIPWRVAFALQADGWWLRSDIIWAKPNPMPESVTDRCTKSHEYIFMLSKSASYFWDAEAIKERYAECTINDSRVGVDVSRGGIKDYEGNGVQNPSDVRARIFNNLGTGRNKRSVWNIPTQAFSGAHFAVFPEEIPKLCILAGTSAKGCCAKCGAPWERIVERGEAVEQRPSWRGEGNAYGVTGGNHAGRTGNWGAERKTLGWQPTCKCDVAIAPCTVLDCFAGSGTTGAVALELGRKAVLIELNPAYVELIEQRCNTTLGLALA